MKYNQYLFKVLVLVCMALQLVSCNDWLDVKPRSEIESDDNYNSEQGYKDALTGIYLLMTDNAMYGKEMTYGMVDAMAQYYTGTYSTYQPYYYAKQYSYKESATETTINSMWSKTYNAIANLNELIQHIDKADSKTFTGRNYHLIRGEAYGLRAFLHFDMLRLFGKSYAAGADSTAIPYEASVTTGVYPLSTVKDVLTKVQADLKTAETELAVDPVISGKEATSTDDATYERDRTFKFNYYAVKLLEARAYLYAQDYTNANAAAQEVIKQQTFYWTPESEYSATEAISKNFVGSEELVFSLYTTNLNTNYSETFTSLNGTYMSDDAYSVLFEEATYQKIDYRWLYLTEVMSNCTFCSKLRQPSGNNSYINRLPLMRISEAYYIAAECALQNSDVATAMGYLNIVRQHRGINTALSASLSVDDAKNEITKEYQKEFWCEGQLYFYYKRINAATIPVYNSKWYTGSATPNYVFPLPDDEIEYGGRTANK
jgi:hypothetical protein